MRTLTIALFLSLVLGAATAASAAPSPITTYPAEEQAHIRCPQDTVVWLNPRAKLWYTRKSKHYANDGYGGFVCKADAVNAGFKQGKN